MELFIVLHSWNRTCENAHREIIGAYPSADSARAGILEQLRSLLDGDTTVPQGKSLRSDPAVELDIEATNHHGPRFHIPSDPEFNMVELWQEDELCQDASTAFMSDWYERFEIEKTNLAGLDERIKTQSHGVVCKLIDIGLVESEPEGLILEHEIEGILKDSMK